MVDLFNTKARSIALLPDFPIEASHLNMNMFFEHLSKSRGANDSDLLLSQCANKLSQYIAESNEYLHFTKAEKPDTRLCLWKRIEQARRFIHHNLERRLVLGEIAKEAHLSVFHFQKVFKAFYQISPTKYLLRVRMNSASKLLASNTLTTRKIALQCGFEDVKYFRKCLANHYRDRAKQLS